MSEVEAKVNELEERIKLLAKAMNLILMEEEELPEDEVKEVMSRLKDWLRKGKDEFIEIEKVV
ncbi:MAG: hypothetical protein QXP60_00585 [Nitrososphaerota archaeon]